MNRNTSADEAWSTVLGVKEGDTSTLLKRIGGVLQLGNDITESIKRHDVGHDLYLGYVNQLLEVFKKMHLGSHIGGVTDNIKPEHIAGLRFCDDLLKRKAPEKTIDRNELEQIYRDIMALIDEVVQSNIDDYLKQYLLKRLDSLRQAVEMYDISGVTPIEHAVNEVIGSAYVDNRIRGKINSTGTGGKFQKIIMGLWVLLQLTNNAAQLPESIDKILPGSKSIAAEIVEKRPMDNLVDTGCASEEEIQNNEE